MPNIAIELAGLAHSAVIELFALDCTPLGGTVYRFHNHTNALAGNLVWQGNVYSAWPVQATGFAITTSGPMPRPTLKVGNLGGLIGVLVRQYGGLKGAKLVRKQTLARYLDAVNFPGGVNATADPNAHMHDEWWFVDRQAERNRLTVTFELASPLDLAGTELPRRQIIASHCWWIQDGGYRGPNCGYTGPAVAKKDDTATANPLEDACGGSLTSCKLRQWPAGELAFGGFPGCGVLRNV